jgi:hypothetical protein
MLQKLVYYSQAWHLVWEERPLFNGASGFSVGCRAVMWRSAG